MKKLLTLSALAAMLASNAFAAEQTVAAMSKKCDEAKIKELGGDAVVKVEKGAAEGIYNVTFDDTKTDSSKLMGKLIAAGCPQ